MKKRIIIITGTGLATLSAVVALAGTPNVSAASMNARREPQTSEVTISNGVLGTVASIKGSSLIINDKSGISYTIDATNAKVTKSGDQEVSLSAIKEGDVLFVRGGISGASIRIR